MCCFAPFAGTGPTVITVPGLGGSGEGHWQTRWERSRLSTVRADLGTWHSPDRNGWVTRLDEAIRQAEAPVILVAHSLGCLTVAWWTQLLPQPYGWPVAGALLVAPPDVERADAPAALGSFSPAPVAPLPFPSILVGSTNDPWSSIDRAHSLAAWWGSRFIDAGPLGHLNADSGVGDWPAGQRLLDGLIDDATVAAAVPTPASARHDGRFATARR